MPDKGFDWDESVVSDTSDLSEHLHPESDTHLHATPEIPSPVAGRLLDFVPLDSHRALRLTCKSWSRAVDKARPLRRPAGNIIPTEILLEIFYMLNPRDFDNARRICSQWMRVSLDQNLLESMLKRAGWWDSWQRDCQTPPSPVEEESLVWKMSKRFSTECVLSGRKRNVERPGFLTTGVVNFSKLSQRQPTQSARNSQSSAGTEYFGRDAAALSKFNVSSCGNYLLVTSGHTIHVYRLLTKRAGGSNPVSLTDDSDIDIAPIANIPCPSGVVSATIDTSAPRFVVAALLYGRVGMVCDITSETIEARNTNSSQLEGTEPRYYYRDVCSTQDPPRSVSICPGRRCVAFGNGSGIELRWIDEVSKQDCRKHFPMSQPSEILHFLPNRPETPEELRVISSLAGPVVSSCQCNIGCQSRACRFHLEADVHSLASLDPRNDGNLSLVRTTHCHNYRVVPINDGLHFLFIEPRTGSLCIGSDAPVGGPTSLTRALVCTPPFGQDQSDTSKEALMPTAFAAGSDLSWGLRVVAAYQDRLVLYSVPLDVFNVIRKERERQGDGVMGDSDLARDWFLDGERSHKRRGSLVPNQNGDWEFLLSVSYRPTAMMWPLKIYGKEIGKMENIVELALQSSYGGARVWAFGASGETSIFDVDTFTSPAQQTTDVPCKSLSIDTDGNIESVGVVDRAETGLHALSRSAGKPESRVGFGGQHSTLPSIQGDMATHSSDLSKTIESEIHASATSRRRPSYAACIVGFNIPELSSREGRWVEHGVA